MRLRPFKHSFDAHFSRGDNEDSNSPSSGPFSSQIDGMGASQDTSRTRLRAAVECGILDGNKQSKVLSLVPSRPFDLRRSMTFRRGLVNKSPKGHTAMLSVVHSAT
jgi:hypothetical protein